MKVSNALRLMLLALLFSFLPVKSFAGVFISVNFAPPILPEYDQPPCPEPGLMWTPGYWAYGEDGYYWIPGTWVPVPYEGALWTPPYWGWDNDLYVFHPGYWGMHVGYYGGVNYGFGYMGIGFVGGMWRGHDFVYNTAVMRVDERYVHTTYVDRTIVERNTIINDRHVAFSGGREGIHHDPAPEERFAEREQHMEATGFQHSHENAAMSDRSMYVNNNGGRPSTTAVQRPLSGGSEGRGNYSGAPGGYNNRPPGNSNERPARGYNGNPPSNNNPPGNYNNRPAGNNSGNQPAPQPQYRPAPQPQQPEYRPAPQPQPQYHPAPQAPPQSQARPAQPPPQQQPSHGGQQQHGDQKDKDHQH